MKKKTYIKLMTATVLASTLLLGACGNKKETTQASSSAKTSQSSSTKAASSNKESKTQKSSSLSTSEKTKVSSTTATQTQATNTSATEQRKGQDVATQQTAAKQTAYDPTTDRKLQDKQAESNKRYKGVLTMVDGNFAAATGNWKGANGETITVSSGGKFTVETADGKKENYSLKGYSYTLDDGKYNAEVGGGKVIQITTGADGKVASVSLAQ